MLFKLQRGWITAYLGVFNYLAKPQMLVLVCRAGPVFKRIGQGSAGAACRVGQHCCNELNL